MLGWARSSFSPSNQQGPTCGLKRSQTAAGQAPETPALSFGKSTLIFPMWTREPSNHVEFPVLFPGRTVSVLIICKACWDPQWQATPDEKNSVKLSDSSVWSFVSMRILNFHSFMRWNTLPETTTGHDEIGFASWKCRCILQHLSPFGTLVLGVLEGMLSDITYP